MKQIKFSKYHGCGNDFIIIKEKDIKNINLTKFVIDICNRYTGIGADGLMIDVDNKIEMKFYNQDGRSGTMCGNGLRSFGAYLKDSNKVVENNFDIITPAGIMKLETITENPYIFKANLGQYFFDTKLLQINTNLSEFKNQVITYESREIICDAVFIGTKHLVVITDNINDLYDESMGKFLSTNQLFEDDINVDFVYIEDRDNIKMHTYERGVGFTKACGTGSCASYIILKERNLCNDILNVHMELGTLKISSIESHIIMEGPAEKICEGIYNWREENVKN